MRKGYCAMRTRIVVALLSGLMVAGCSGAGSGSLQPPGGDTTKTTNQEVAQAATEAAFAPIESGDLENGLYNGTMGVALSTTRAQSSAFRSTSGSCTNGKEHIVTIISATQTQYETKYFFDPTCGHLARDVVALVTMNSASSESVTRTATNYNLSGLVLSTRRTNFAITGAPGDFSAIVTSGLYIGTSTSAAAHYGRQVTVAPQTSNIWTLAANSGRVVNVGIPSINESFGHMGVLQNGTVTIDNVGNVVFVGTHTGTFLKGPFGSLTLSAAPPFTVSGGSTLGTTTVQGSVTFDATGQLTNVSITGTLWNGDNIALSSSGNPGSIAINGTITTAGGGPVATFSVDQYGDGVITYANGAQALIVDWHVIR